MIVRFRLTVWSGGHNGLQGSIAQVVESKEMRFEEKRKASARLAQMVMACGDVMIPGPMQLPHPLVPPIVPHVHRQLLQ